MTRPYKDIRGNWAAETQFDAGNGRTGEIITMKVSDGSLKTTVKVGKRNDWCFEYTPYQDFFKCTKVSRPGRVTAKFVEEQHCAAVAIIETLKKEIDFHYLTV